MEKDGKRQSYPQLHGTWDGAFSATWEDGSQQLLWQKNPPHEHSSRCLAHSGTPQSSLQNPPTPGTAVVLHAQLKTPAPQERQPRTASTE